MPRYIETLPKKGYRFVGKVEAVGSGSAALVEDGRAETDIRPDSAQQAGHPQGLKPRASTDAPAARLKSCPDTKQSQVGQSDGPSLEAQRWKYVSAVALILGVAAVVGYWMLRPRVPVVTAIHQLTRTGNAKGTLATDGMRVYFTERFGGRGHLAQVSVKGGEVSYIETPLIKNPGISDIADDASELLLYEATSKFEDPPWIYPLPNGPARKIPGPDLGLPKLLPGNKQVAYILASDPNRLFMVNLDGSAAHSVLSAPGSIVNFAIAPDGHRVRLVVGGKIWEAGLDGSGLHRFLPQHQEPMYGGQWSPDGRLYTFLSGDREASNVWAVTESRIGSYYLTPRPVQLTFGPVLFWNWTANKEANRIFALGSTQHGELVAFAPHSDQHRSYLNGISASFCDFSRDGQWVTYVAYPEGTLWRSRLDGSERQQLTFPPMGLIVNPRWSPDGRFIAFVKWMPGEIYLVPADGGSPMLLLAGDSVPRIPPGRPTASPLHTAAQLTRKQMSAFSISTAGNPQLSPDQSTCSVRGGRPTDVTLQPCPTTARNCSCTISKRLAGSKYHSRPCQSRVI